MSNISSSPSITVGYSNSSLDSSVKSYDPYMPTGMFCGTSPSSVDYDGKIKMNHNCVHIQPTNNGFIVTVTTKDEGIRSMCFENMEKVLEYVNDLGIMDRDTERVADNV